jgi:hypothetical protein
VAVTNKLWPASLEIKPKEMAEKRIGRTRSSRGAAKLWRYGRAGLNYADACRDPVLGLR